VAKKLTHRNAEVKAWGSNPASVKDFLLLCGVVVAAVVVDVVV